MDLASEVKKNCNGLSAKACANTYRGLTGFEGVKPFHTHGHFVRAIMESTSKSLANLTATLKGDGFSGKVISTGGGAKSRLWVSS